MATRYAWMIALTLMMTAGCQSSGRGSRKPIEMLPAAGFDDRPRAKAVEAPRGVTGGSLSTAAATTKPGGEEESLFEYPFPPAPKDTIPTPPKTELPPPPLVNVTPTPPSLPPVPSSEPTAPTAPPPSPVTPLTLTPPTTAPVLPQPTLAPPTLAAPEPVAPPTPMAVPSPAVPMSRPTPTPPANNRVDATMPLPSSPLLPQPVGQTPPLVVESRSGPSATPSEVVAELRRLRDKASQRYASMDTYTMRMRRREMVGDKSRPEELILGKFRKEPFSVYLKWVGEEGRNREICYVKGRYEDAIHTMMSPTDLFLFAGKHMKFSPDNPLVKSNSRYPVSEAGLGPLIQRFHRLTTAMEANDPREGTAKYLGTLKRPEFDEPVDGVLQTLPAKSDPNLPAGGQRFWFFDRTHGLPVLIVTLDERDREVEYYCHDRIQGPANLDDDDFNPYRMWKK